MRAPRAAPLVGSATSFRMRATRASAEVSGRRAVRGLGGQEAAGQQRTRWRPGVHGCRAGGEHHGRWRAAGLYTPRATVTTAAVLDPCPSLLASNSIMILTPKSGTSLGWLGPLASSSSTHPGMLQSARQTPVHSATQLIPWKVSSAELISGHASAQAAVLAVCARPQLAEAAADSEAFAPPPPLAAPPYGALCPMPAAAAAW